MTTDDRTFPCSGSRTAIRCTFARLLAETGAAESFCQEAAAMFSFRGSWALARAPILLAAILPPARAAEERTRAEITKLLDVGWGITSQARAAADLQYEEVERA